jgi:hypothetical protein
VSIPDTIVDLPVVGIGDNAFAWDASLTSVTISNSVSNIASYAFSSCPDLTDAYFLGNAPTADCTVFSGDTKATVHYFPNTTGWGPTFACRPAVPWLPQVQTLGPSFGVRTNQFGFNITWASGMTIVVEASTTLVNPTWLPLQTNILSGGTLYFSDAWWTNSPRRFYRIVGL